LKDELKSYPSIVVPELTTFDLPCLLVLPDFPQPIPVFTSATDSRLSLGFSYVIVSLLRMQNSLSSLLDTFVTVRRSLYALLPLIAQSFPLN
jgi:hypothetical protein